MNVMKEAQISMFKKHTIGLNTYKLAEGDIIHHYNAIFRLKERTQYDDCVAFTTELVEWKDGPMPNAWAESYTIQGNELAHWNVISKA